MRQVFWFDHLLLGLVTVIIYQEMVAVFAYAAHTEIEGSFVLYD